MLNSPKIKFGTDGWRGVISDDFTFQNVRIVAQAISNYFKQTPNTQHLIPRVVVGYDTRFLSDKYALVTSDVLIANGIKIILSDRPCPTPVVSFTVKNKKFDAGIMITASHNPPQFNGIKIKTSSGGAAGPEVTREIEKLISKSNILRRLPPASHLVVCQDLTPDYINFIKSYINLSRLKDKKFKILVDLMYGSGNGYISQILKSTPIQVNLIHNEINPSFGGVKPEPIEENLKELTLNLKNGEFDIGLALDGDADRIAAIRPDGRFINAHEIISLLLLHLVEDRHKAGGLAKTVAGGILMEKIAKRKGIKIYETPVGFKYISALMEKENILIGGEEAGGIGFKGYTPERDGTLAGLLLLEMMAYRNKGIIEIMDDIEREFGRFYYMRKDLAVKSLKLKVKNFKRPNRLLGEKVKRIKDYDGIKFICEDDSWLLLRPSGTEPIVRIYAEARNQTRTRELIKLGEKLVLVEIRSRCRDSVSVPRFGLDQYWDDG